MCQSPCRSVTEKVCWRIQAWSTEHTVRSEEHMPTPLPISCWEEHQWHAIRWNARGRTMLLCYHAKIRNVFLCLSIDDHLKWTTPVVRLPVLPPLSLSLIAHTRMPLLEHAFVMWTTLFDAYCLIQMINGRAYAKCIGTISSHNGTGITHGRRQVKSPSRMTTSRMTTPKRGPQGPSPITAFA